MSISTALIATLPKSGTWYCHSFFWCYDQLLRNRDAFRAGQFSPDLDGTLRNQKISNLTHHADTFGIDDLYICHSACPGFENAADPRMEEWKTLTFPLPSNWGDALLRKHKKWDALNPAFEPKARVVYLFRNPLDHFVSYYRHILNHKDANHRMKRLEDGQLVPIQDLHDFVFDFGMLGAFIKHYYSFRAMHERFPQQVMLMPYERLTGAPEDAFAEVLTFIGAPKDDDLIGHALTLSSKESLKAIEDKLGRSLAHDQKKGERHIRDGGSGKWEAHFNDGELAVIESVFAAFGMTLEEFALNPSPAASEKLAKLKDISPAEKEAHQADFFRRQRLRQSQQQASHSDHSPLRLLGKLARRVQHGFRSDNMGEAET